MTLEVNSTTSLYAVRSRVIIIMKKLNIISINLKLRALLV